MLIKMLDNRFIKEKDIQFFVGKEPIYTIKDFVELNPYGIRLLPKNKSVSKDSSGTWAVNSSNEIVFMSLGKAYKDLVDIYQSIEQNNVSDLEEDDTFDKFCSFLENLSRKITPIFYSKLILKPSEKTVKKGNQNEIKNVG